MSAIDRAGVRRCVRVVVVRMPARVLSNYLKTKLRDPSVVAVKPQTTWTTERLRSADRTLPVEESVRNGKTEGRVWLEAERAAVRVPVP
jgi:hypothetical protein